MSDNDVSQFLEQVQQLKGRHLEEDEARSRELEERIRQEKSERAARRAERARSISPQKSSPANTPDRTSNPRFDASKLTSSPPVLESPQTTRPESTATMESSLDEANSPSKENDSPFDADYKRTSLASPLSSLSGPRSSPLSWQRRPNSQTSERPKSRPLSMYAAENAARTTATTTEPEPATTEVTLSKDQIAQSLAGKDPSWFRQTADRGSNSAAYRRSQVEDDDRLDMGAGRAQLPGMTPPASARERPTSAASTPTASARAQSATMRTASPFDLSSAQRLDPPVSSPLRQGPVDPEQPPRSPERPPTRPGLDGRASPTRPLSPTKGMGGFVQSAMMKRSDSIKRWSVTSPPGLARADSLAQGRTSPDRVAGVAAQPLSRPASMIRDGSTTPTSRPQSRQGLGAKQPQSADTASRPVADLPLEANPNFTSPRREEKETTPPTSPSRTMDPRRWSPTKSSWLEAALNKPESPKPKPTPPSNFQPAWMVELNKAKAQKAATVGGSSSDTNSTDPDAPRSGPVPSHKHDVKIGGLLRPSPLNARNATKPTTNSTSTSTAPSTSTSASPTILSSSSTVASRLASSTTSSAAAPAASSSSESRARSISTVSKPADTLDRSAPSTRDSVAEPAAASGRPTSTSGKVDFRANLKPRQQPGGPGGKSADADEFKNVFGNLRRTKTQNYVAPDELKGNILRGKAALNITGGPKPSERKDEFKEAILKKKEDFKKAQIEGKGVQRTSGSTAEQSIPEGLAKRIELGRSPTTAPRRDSATSQTTTGRASPAPPSPAATPRQAPTPKRTSVDVTKRVATQAALASPSATSNRPSTKQGVGSLADRFNPALAGLLARGPPAAAPLPSNDGESKTAATKGSSSGSVDTSEPSAPGPQLTHITKGRARGPRRKAPSSSTVATAQATASRPSDKHSPTAEQSPPITSGGMAEVSSPQSSAIQTTIVEAPARSDQVQLVDSSKSSGQIKLVDSSAVRSAYSSPSWSTPRRTNTEPATPGQVRLVDSSALRDAYDSTTTVSTPRSYQSSYQATATSPQSLQAQAAAVLELKGPAYLMKIPASPTESVDSKPEGATSQPSSPKKLDMKRLSKFMDESSQSNPPSATVASPRPRSPTKTAQPEPVEAATTGGVRSSASAVSAAASAPTSQQQQPPTPTGLDRQQPLAGSQGPFQPAPPVQPFLKFEPVPVQVQYEPVYPEPQYQEFQPTFHIPGYQPPPPRQPEPLVYEPVYETPVIQTAEPIFLPQAQQQPPAQYEEQQYQRPVSRRMEPAAEPIPPSPAKRQERPLPLVPGPASPPAISSPMRSPTKQVIEAAAALNDFFGPERPKREYRADAAQLLMNRPASSTNIETRASHFFQFTGDGKKVPVPSHNERVLFEREMYLLMHQFTTSAGRKASEVYFWVGDEVPTSTAEDADVFARREAKAFGGKLITIPQGKESPEFLLAMGGVVVTRRGSSNKYDSLAPNMLCGRRHLGQVTFDQVDFSPSSLCSGFPYLITQQGRCTLWKGKGSDIDELSCARLVGMESSLTGELEEVEDGNEPATFWDTFDGGSKPLSADHWRLKPNYTKYGARLFRSDEVAKQQITELCPFNQADLRPEAVYVLDAFFEMYIIVGAQAQGQYAAFRNALDFAQEYAILASGMEDRPFVPISTVVLEGIPRDLKSVFRKWSDLRSPTMTNTAASLRRGRSLRIVPLTQALQAVAE